VRSLTFAVAVLLAGCSESSAPPNRPILAGLRIVAGAGQHGTVGTALPGPIVVEAVDAAGVPMANQAVAFATVGGTLSTPSVATGANGQASTDWTLGTIADTQRVVAMAETFADTMMAVAIAASADSIRKVAGDLQSGAPGSVLAESLSVSVRDRYGNPVAGIAVAWTVTAGGGVVSPGASATNPSGIAKTRWTLGRSGPQSVGAAVASLSPTAFHATVGPQPLYRVRVVPPADSLHAIKDVVPLTATVADSLGNPIAGAVVTWSNLNPTVLSLVTNSNNATTTAAANGIARVLASYKGIADTVVIVIAQVVENITITGDPIVALGATIPLGAVATDSNNVAVPSQALAYMSLDTTRVTVSASGVLRGVAYGSALVFAGAPAPPSYGYPIGNPSSEVYVSVTHQPVSQAVFTSIATTVDHACLLTTIGEAYCWGDNQTRESSDPPNSATLIPTPIPSGNGILFKQLAVMTEQTCGLGTDGAVYCWGAGWAVHDSVPTKVSGAPVFVTISANALSACGLTAAGVAYCWGENDYGELGTGSNAAFTTWVPVAGGYTFRSITVGDGFACGLIVSGATYCWGRDDEGQLGTGADPNTLPTCSGQYAQPVECANAPLPVAGQLAFTSLAAGDSHVCGLTSGGLTYCWGTNGYGELGIGNATGPGSCSPYEDASNPVACSLQPVQVTGSAQFSTVAAGTNTTCALTANGAAWCWGMLGVGPIATPTPTPAPTAIAGGHAFSALNLIPLGACGLTTTAGIYCWGVLNQFYLNYGGTPTLVPHP
jgi:alpha-tubulin suppressor-like RCC1 family protein